MEPACSSLKALVFILSETNVQTLGRFCQVSKECKIIAESDNLWKSIFPVFSQLEIGNLKIFINENKINPHDIKRIDSIESINTALDIFKKTYNEEGNNKIRFLFPFDKGSVFEYSIINKNDSNFNSIDYIFSKKICGENSESTPLAVDYGCLKQLHCLFPCKIKDEYYSKILSIISSIIKESVCFNVE